MTRLLIFLIIALFASTTPATAAVPVDATDPIATGAPRELKDLYFGEALYDAFLGDWFDAIARLDTEREQHYRLDQPELDSLFVHIGQAEFAVGDFELAYRMHRRAGRAISRLIDGNLPEPQRNEALFRLAKICFRKDRPEEALAAVQRIGGAVPPGIRDDVLRLRAQILMANGRFAEAAQRLREFEEAGGPDGFASYNLGIALMKDGQEEEGLGYLDRAGRTGGDSPAILAIRDKANMVLGDKLLTQEEFAGAKEVFDRVRLNGPFSNRALLGSGWADASREDFRRALVPWSLLIERKVTDPAVQEGLLAVPYAYGKLGVYSKAALMYGRALGTFGEEVDKLDASIRSIREGKFLQALLREELKRDSNWLVRLRNLPEAPETWYLLDLMASHDFQESLKNYLDLEDLRRKLTVWEGDLDAYEEIIEKRRSYYEPLLPEIDGRFRRLDSQMRLRLEQRSRIDKRLREMLTAPRPEFLATADERIAGERLGELERSLAAAGPGTPPELAARIARLRGALEWNIRTEYDRRLTDACRHQRELDRVIEQLQRQYEAFVRTRQAATQSYRGFDEDIRRRRMEIRDARKKVEKLMARQGSLLETLAVRELSARRQRLEEFQVKARFALADSYDRAARAEGLERMEP